ncbi:unnamed protein product, partial [Scytosiphon promiscuus]
MSTLSSSPRGNRDASPPRLGILDLVRDLARLRETEPARFPAAYDELKETVGDLDHLLKVFDPPPSSPLTPTSTFASPRGGDGGGGGGGNDFGNFSFSHTSSSGRRPRAAASSGSPLGGVGELGTAGVGLEDNG